MRILPRVLAVSVVLALILMPLIASAEGDLLPIDKKVLPGTSVVDYAGQHLRFTTPVGLVVRFEPVFGASTKFKMTVWQYPGTQIPATAAVTEVEIVWTEWGNQIFTGPPPGESDPYIGILNTESGFTEK